MQDSLLQPLYSCLSWYSFFSDHLDSGFLEGPITNAITKACPTYSIRIARMHYNVTENRIGGGSVALTALILPSRAVLLRSP
jgi:hypothetical protein